MERKAERTGGTVAALSGVGCLLTEADGVLLPTAGALLLRACSGLGEVGAAA